MVSRSTARRALTAAVVAAAVASVGASTANAKVVTVTDNTAAEFSDPQATPSNTVVRTLAAGDGAVELARPLAEQFDAPLTAPWTSAAWAVGGAATVAGGSLLVDGASVNSGVPGGQGSSVQFTADLGTEPFRHAGFAADFNAPPWAIFSTGGGALPTGVYARTSDGDGVGLADIDELLTVTPGTHTYRIDWTATGFVYFVDGVQVASHAIPLVNAMPPAASDFNVGAGGVSIDSIALGSQKTGVFTSRKLDAGDARVTGLSFAPTNDLPATTAISYETRSADTLGGLDAATWSPLGASGTVASTPARFLQYRATLTTPNPAVTPRLDKVDVGFTVDDQAPAVTIQGVAVSGTGAKVTFSSDDASADVECALDGASFAACASPKELTGLTPGSHTIVVRATDGFDNVGSATKTFDVAQAPPAGSGTTPSPPGGTTPPPPAGPAPDRIAPTMLVIGRSMAVSAGGVAKLRVRCPRSEKSCAVAVKLKLGGKTVARKSLTLSGGSTRSFRLKLSKAARTALAARSRLTVTAVVAAEDAAGNRKTTTRRMTLRAPAV